MAHACYSGIPATLPGPSAGSCALLTQETCTLSLAAFLVAHSVSECSLDSSHRLWREAGSRGAAVEELLALCTHQKPSFSLISGRYSDRVFPKQSSLIACA